MEHPKDVGDRTTLAVTLVLRDVGFAVSVPFGENTRYDLVIDDGNRLRRVQCKTGRLRDGAVRFATCSSYLIPIDAIATRREGSLRVEPTRNGQRRLIRHAEEYEIGRVAVRVNRALRASSDARGSSA